MNFTAASSKKQLYNFKGQFNAAVQSIFAAGGLTAQIERSNATLPTSRVEITFDMGEAANQAAMAGDVVYDFYQGNRLDIRLCTVRPLDQPSVLPGIATLHDEFCATTYALLEERLYPFTNYLPYYQVNMIRPKGSQSGLEMHFMEDYTTLLFEVWFGIRPSAWPTS
jgi:hypothetical protein